MSDPTQRAIAGTTASAIRAIWQRNLPQTEQRIDTLAVTAELVNTGSLAEAQRLEASDIAHKLAGSLGMFGFPEGTQIARQLENMLDSKNFNADEATMMNQLVTRLRVLVLGAS